MKELKDYLADYNADLAGNSYTVSFSDGKPNEIIEFEEVNFPHLTGLEYCFPANDQENYKGQKAVDGINDESINNEELKKVNFKVFEKTVARKLDSFEHFYNKFCLEEFNITCCFFRKDLAVKAHDKRELDKFYFVIESPINTCTYVLAFGKNKISGKLYPLSIRKEFSQVIDYLDLQTKIKCKIKKNK